MKLIKIYTIVTVLFLFGCSSDEGGAADPGDSTPDEFSFKSKRGVERNSEIVSNTIIISGIDNDIEATVSNGALSVNGEAFRSNSQIVKNGDSLTVKLTSSILPLTSSKMTVQLGGVSKVFKVTTESLSKRPFQGFVKSVTGGLGGTIVKVTNLNPSGPGSLQEAVNQEGARTVVFDVSGVIDADIRIPHGNITIAGQTAPGNAGVTINGHLYTPYGDAFGNIIVQHIRVRPSFPGGNWPAESHDAIQFSSNFDVILDHVDVSHAADELIDIWGGARSVTIQWSILSYPRYDAGHPKGAIHNYGILSGPDGGEIVVHHNIFAHSSRRLPAIASGPSEVINNIIYNSKEAFVHHNPADGMFNIVGNVYLAGINGTLLPFWLDPENSDPRLSYYFKDNKVADVAFDAVVDNPMNDESFKQTYAFYNSRIKPDMFKDSLHDFSETPSYEGVVPDSSSSVLDRVLECAGAWPRDETSNRAISSIVSMNGEWENSVPDLTKGLLPAQRDPSLDLDNDGMLDEWELEHGLDPSEPLDYMEEIDNGRSAIEVYLEYKSLEVMGNNINCIS
ncbi:MAG: pectate lyase precursor [Oceanospirillaceae bacterium]|nr:pectate lyase precursor [Oceanospirillaceae bacterium]